jgi:hypothetical protein
MMFLEKDSGKTGGKGEVQGLNLFSHVLQLFEMYPKTQIEDATVCRGCRETKQESSLSRVY